MKHYDLTAQGIEHLIRDVEERKRWLQRKTDELAARLAEIGRADAEIQFTTAFFDGDIEAKVEVEPRGESQYAVVADGRDVLFVEFGAGITYAEPQHPEAGVNGMGVGTYPGQKHAFDPNGWYKPKSVGGGHTYGTPPQMPMYNAVKYLEQNLERIAQEVFAN